MDLRAHDDASGNFHKDGLVDRILQKCQMRGTVVYFNVKDTNAGIITVGMEGEFATAANLATEFDNNSLSVKYRATASSTTEDGVADIQGTTVVADTLV
jgi:hypothetical protein